MDRGYPIKSRPRKALGNVCATSDVAFFVVVILKELEASQCNDPVKVLPIRAMKSEFFA